MLGLINYKNLRNHLYRNLKVQFEGKAQVSHQLATVGELFGAVAGGIGLAEPFKGDWL